MPDGAGARIWAVTGAVAAALLLPADARAHKIRVFAEAKGRMIRGEVYLSGGGTCRNVEVVVRGPRGAELGRTRTDEKGVFQFAPTVRCDHKFIVETQDGHRAEFPLEAGELPPGLPAPAGGAVASTPPPAATSPATAPAAGEPADQTPEALAAILRRAVRKELAASEDRVRMRDVLGGIGYIFGVLGVVMMWKCRKRRGAS